MSEPNWSQTEAARLLIKMLIKDGETVSDALWIATANSASPVANGGLSHDRPRQGDTVTNLADFLLARIAEDEAVAREGGPRDGGIEIAWRDVGGISESLVIGTDRVRAECEIKRQLVALTIPYVLRILALPYATHPEYRSEWLP